MTLWAARSRARIAELWATATDGAHDLGHLDRVWKSCRLIALDGWPQWPQLLAPLLQAALWPVASVLLLAPQRRAHDPDDIRPL